MLQYCPIMAIPWKPHYYRPLIKSQQATAQAEINSLQNAVNFTLCRCDKPCGNVPLCYQCFPRVHYHCQLTETHTTNFPVIVARCTACDQQHQQWWQTGTWQQCTSFQIHNIITVCNKLQRKHSGADTDCALRAVPRTSCPKTTQHISLWTALCLPMSCQT